GPEHVGGGELGAELEVHHEPAHRFFVTEGGPAARLRRRLVQAREAGGATRQWRGARRARVQVPGQAGTTRRAARAWARRCAPIAALRGDPARESAANLVN